MKISVYRNLTRFSNSTENHRIDEDFDFLVSIQQRKI